MAGSPLSDGLFMPAEWEPHGRCWMAWPCRLELWGGDIMAAQVAFAAVARAIPPGAKRRGETRVSIRGDSWKRYTCDYHAYRSD